MGEPDDVSSAVSAPGAPDPAALSPGPAPGANPGTAADRRRADTRHLVRASLLVTVMDMGARVLGVLRDSVAAAIYGVSRATDAFQVAKSLPDMFSTWIEGPVRAAFLPLFTRALHEEGEDRAWEVASNVLNCLAVLLVVLVIVLELVSSHAVRLFSSGFRDPATWEQSARLAEILVLSIVFSVLAAILSSLQNIYRRQLFPALGRVAASLAVLVMIAGFGNRLGLSAWALGILAGAVIGFVLQLSIVARNRKRYRFVFRPRAPEIRNLLAVAFPLFIGLTGTRIDVLLDRNFASYLPEGRLTVLILATAVSGVVADLVLNVSQSVMFPHFAHLVASKQFEELRRRLAQAMDGYFLFIMGATALFCGGARPIVELLFQRGRFTPEDAAITAAVLPILALGAPPHMVGQVLSQVYVSSGQTMTLMKVGFWRIGFKALVSLALFVPFGIVGLAVASSTSSYFRFVLLWRRLAPDQRPRFATMARPALIVTASSAIAAVVTFGLYALIPPFDGGPAAQGARVALVSGVALLVFGASALALGHELSRGIVGTLRGRLARR